MVLNRIYEEGFLGFSYRFRPGRGQHDALARVTCRDHPQKKVSWILDADIAGFFDRLSQTWLLRFLEHKDSRSASAPPDPQMAEGRYPGGWPCHGPGAGDAARVGDFTAAC